MDANLDAGRKYLVEELGGASKRSRFKNMGLKCGCPASGKMSKGVIEINHCKMLKEI